MSDSQIQLADVDPAYVKVISGAPEVKKIQQKVSIDAKTALFYVFFGLSLFIICCFGLIAES